MLKIYSHPRSGTHFLEAFVAKNFYPDEDLSVENLTWGHWSNRKFSEINPYGKLFGSHSFPRKNFRPKIKPILYIYRDGRAVAYSIWKTPNFLNKEMSDLSFSEFLRTPIDWKGSPAHKSEPKYTIVEHWSKHVEEWFNLRGKANVIFISYEELIDNPDKIYRYILLRRFPYKIHKLWYKKLETIDKPLGLLPNQGIKDSWRDVFTENDIEYFRKNTPEWLYNKFQN